MRLVDKSASEFLYQQVIDFVEHQQRSGAIRPGDKLPSLRKLSRQFDISVPTVKQAYIELERQGTISARPQSGYYLKATQARTLLPVNAHPPDKTLARLMRSVLSRVSEKAVSYGPVNGDAKLRLNLAFRYQECGALVNHDDLIITNGAQEALSIALQCVAERGDIIAVESPCYFGIIELIESLGMKALEVYTCTEEGVCVAELAKVIEQHAVKACLFSSAFPSFC